MPENQKALCDKCGAIDFEYDSYWKEYSCKNCGFIVENAVKISSLNKIRNSYLTKKAAIQKENSKPTRERQIQKKKSSSIIKPPAAALTQKETQTPKEEVSHLCNKAMAAIERNDIAAAFQDLTRAEALDLRDPLVQLLLFQAYGITRDYDLSAKHFQALRELDPATAEKALKSMPDSLQTKMNSIQNNDVIKRRIKFLKILRCGKRPCMLTWLKPKAPGFQAFVRLWLFQPRKRI